MVKVLISISTIFITKVSTSYDDIFWLSPFIAKDKKKTLLFYILGLFTIATISLIFSLFMSYILEALKLKIELFQIFSFSMLLLYSFFIIRLDKEKFSPHNNSVFLLL